MKLKTTLTLGAAFLAALLTLLIPRTASAQSFLYSGTMTDVVLLGPGTYDITAYGAQGGYSGFGGPGGGLGVEMEAQFNFAQMTTLTILVGGSGGGGYSGGGGGASFYSGYGGGGGGGSYIDSSGIMLTEVSGIASPDGSPNGEIIISAVPEPATLLLAGLGGLSLLGFRRRK